MAKGHIVTSSSADTTDTLTADLPEYPMARAAGCPFDPPPTLRKVQSEHQIARVRIWDGSSPWLVTGYDNVRNLLSDPRLSTDGTKPSFPHQSALTKARRGEPTPFGTDDPEHARQRRTVSAAFAIKHVEAMRPAIQRIVDDQIDTMLAGPNPVDFVDAFALPVPSLVICNMLGVPYSDHHFFESRTKLLLTRAGTPERSAQAARELITHLEQLVDDKLANPADDVVSSLAKRVAAGEITRDQAARLSVTLLIGGHETTANMISLGTLALLQHPEQLDRVRENSENPAIIGSAVEELLRWLSVPHSGRRRVALEDIEIGGVEIRAGESVILANDIANRDPAVFADPDHLDIDRNPRKQIAFGFGVHQCLGQSLARVELQVVYSTLYRRVPTLRLATDLDQIPFKHDGILYGVYAMPITW